MTRRTNSRLGDGRAEADGGASSTNVAAMPSALLVADTTWVVNDVQAALSRDDWEITLVDDLAPGDVAVFACGGPTDRIAPWGELLSTAAQVRGATGCVTDGLVRDVGRIRAMGFPVFHGGIGPRTRASGRRPHRLRP